MDDGYTATPPTRLCRQPPDRCRKWSTPYAEHCLAEQQGAGGGQQRGRRPDLFAEHSPAVDESCTATRRGNLLHSRFRRKDRSGEITPSWNVRHRGRRRPGLVVATQVVEVCLDVDFDILFTSAAPLEALLPAFRPRQPTW